MKASMSTNVGAKRRREMNEDNFRQKRITYTEYMKREDDIARQEFEEDRKRMAAREKIEGARG